MAFPEWLQPHVDSFVAWVNATLENWGLDYVEVGFRRWLIYPPQYLLWLFLPIIIAFLLPVFLLVFIYACVIFIHIYQFRNRIREAYASSYWDGARASIASFWDGVGWLWHGGWLAGECR